MKISNLSEWEFLQWQVPGSAVKLKYCRKPVF